MLKQKKRISEKPLIKNRAQYDKLFPEYSKLLTKLEVKFKLQSNGNLASLVNFKTNKDIPKHGWFEYKQGYSESLVEEIILKERPSKSHYVLDPFTGVGTTNLVSQKLGYKSIGFDINPIATFIANSKTIYFEQKEIDLISKYVSNFKPTRVSKFVPKSPLLERSFHPAAFNQLMHIKGFYEGIANKHIQSFFKTAYLAIIEDCSLRVKDGNGIKMVPNKKYVTNVYEYYIEKCKNMSEDINQSNYKKVVKIFNGSFILNRNHQNGDNSKVGIVIFSPPYANCFDYCEVYKLELWMGGFVKQYEDFKKYRSIALRSHVNSSFNHAIENRNESVKVISDLISCFNIWNKNIPDMILGYFDDMTKVLTKLFSLMVPGAGCYIVVANSGYKGVLVPTDLLLAGIADDIGFKVEKIIKARTIRASSQQMSILHGTYKRLMRESIIIIRKP